MLANSYRTVTTLSELTLTDTHKPCHCHYVCYDLYPLFPVPDFSVRAISISNAFVRVSKVLLVLVLDFPKPERYTSLAKIGVRLTAYLDGVGVQTTPMLSAFLRPHISPSDYAICNHWLTLLSGNPTLTCQTSVCIVPFHTLPIYDVFALTIRFYRIFHVPACLS